MKKKQKERKPGGASTVKASFSKASTSSTASLSKSIRSERSLVLPDPVKKALQKLDASGHVAYVVGGCVRDFLMGKESKDYDIATSAHPDELCRLFPKAVTVGKLFGVIKVPTGSQPPLLEIATFRQDLEYRDHRHPQGVVFSGPMVDAKRRDFTVNALFYDPKSSRILDFVDGLQDLNAGIIRAIGNPAERFHEDALRLLRAVRFKTRLDFKFDPETAAAVQARAKLITRVSAERIRDELTLMFTGPRPSQSLKHLSELGLLSYVLPEVEALRGVTQVPSGYGREDLWTHLIRVMGCLEVQYPVRSPTLAWAAVLHEIGKPVVSQKSGGKGFSGHETESAKMAVSIASRLRMSRSDSDRISAMIADHLKFREVFQMREATLQRLIRTDHFEELLAFHRADATATDGNVAFYEFCASRLDELKRASSGEGIKLLDGKDLIQLGFEPGPEFTEILRTIEDLTFEKKIRSKEEALEYVIKTFVK